MPINAIYHPGTDTTYLFADLKGTVAAPGMIMKKIEQQGVDGMAFKKLASRSEARLLTSRTFLATAAAAETIAQVDYTDLQGEQVTIYDHFGWFFSGVVVLRVNILFLKQRGATLQLGAFHAGPVEVRAQWTVQYPFGSI